MRNIFIKLLNVLRYKVIARVTTQRSKVEVVSNRQIATDIIKGLLSPDKPCMIARYGAFEGAVVLNYLGTKSSEKSIVKYIMGQCEAWWWNKKLLNSFHFNAGFFPLDDIQVAKYCELMLKDSKELDVVGCFDKNNNAERLCAYHENCKYVRLAHLEPNFSVCDSSSEWLSLLKGKRVLVIHPFADTIKTQYKIREMLFADPNFLPEFDLKTIKAIQSIGGENTDFPTWFDALKYMEDEMDKQEYDIAIIGCGAYGFNLAAHAKRTGHKAIHLGGCTQLLFGIRGNRWESRDEYRNLMNDYWVRPCSSDIPNSASKIENGCYW